jgi:hypothetical protein
MKFNKEFRLLFIGVSCAMFLLVLIGCTPNTRTSTYTTTSTPDTPTSTTTSSITSPTTTDFNGVNLASYTSANGLSLSLSLDSKTYLPGREVSIVIDVKNTLLTENDVAVSDNWSYSYLTLGQCGTYLLPFGVALLQGYYSSTNIPTATPLMFYDYSVQPCPIVFGKITTYDFKPSSDIATIQYKSQPGTQPIKTNVAFSLQLTGYWTGSPPPIKKNFDPGDYTVVAGDEWGNLLIVHFTVSQ